jgi:preprotein translocase subunit YajC
LSAFDVLASLIQTQAPGPGARGGLNLMIITIAFIAIMWFIILAPQRKMQKRHQQMIADLKRGDEIMTDGGIIGTIVHLAEDRLTVKTAENTRVVVARSKIARVMGQPAEPKP